MTNKAEWDQLAARLDAEADYRVLRRIPCRFRAHQIDSNYHTILGLYWLGGVVVGTRLSQGSGSAEATMADRAPGCGSLQDPLRN